MKYVKTKINKNIDAVSNSVNVCNSTRVVSHDATICPLTRVFYSTHSRQTAFHDASPPDNSMHSVETMLRVGYGLFTSVGGWRIKIGLKPLKLFAFYFVRNLLSPLSAASQTRRL